MFICLCVRKPVLYNEFVKYIIGCFLFRFKNVISLCKIRALYMLNMPDIQ